MNTRFTSQGFTLIEVTLALALAASVLVAILVIRGRLIRQSSRTQMVARANVLAGHLVGEWKNGHMPCDVGQEQQGKDSATGYRWQLNCNQQEVEAGIFLKCLRVKVYADPTEQEPTIAFEAWQPLR